MARTGGLEEDEPHEAGLERATSCGLLPSVEEAAETGEDKEEVNKSGETSPSLWGINYFAPLQPG